MVRRNYTHIITSVVYWIWISCSYMYVVMDWTFVEEIILKRGLLASDNTRWEEHMQISTAVGYVWCLCFSQSLGERNAACSSCFSLSSLSSASLLVLPSAKKISSPFTFSLFFRCFKYVLSLLFGSFCLFFVVVFLCFILFYSFCFVSEVLILVYFICLQYFFCSVSN